ncbi:hypothetical protein [Anaerophaga thermohalophila]|jgi:hypothetical protein|uniref:hypothetical protein n=1 Tax=Anaerophaga thermohalophila TaxID=177400 RepID=UPI00037C1C66|nr:hypothetical protein [Anaerophaga thermohalophila]
MRHLREAMIFLAACFVSNAEGQIPTSGSYPKGAFLERLYEPRQKMIGEDTLFIRPRWFFPSHVKVQYAGSVGFISVGAGYRLWDIYEPTLMYGYLSESMGGSNVSVHTISLKNSFYLTSSPWLGHFWPRVGLLINWGNTKNTFRKLPPHYPEKYYFQNKMHLAPFWGGEWHFHIKDKHLSGIGIYFEFSALDAYLLEAVRTDYVRMTDIWSLGIGISFYFQ